MQTAVRRSGPKLVFVAPEGLKYVKICSNFMPDTGLPDISLFISPSGKNATRTEMSRRKKMTYDLIFEVECLFLLDEMAEKSL